jgi:hypothetical protein
MANGRSVIRNKLRQFPPHYRDHVVRRSWPASLLDRDGESFRAPRSRFGSSLRATRQRLCLGRFPRILAAIIEAPRIEELSKSVSRDGAI